jgi:hypothetical protein
MASAADGSVAVLEDAGSGREDRRVRGAWYAADGTPGELVVLADVFRPLALADDGRRIVLLGSEGAARLVRADEEPTVHELSGRPPIDRRRLWVPGWTLDGRELWLLDPSARRLHRLALPEGS